MPVSGIYKIQSKIKPERIYIGSAVNVPQRWRIHKTELRHDKHINKKLQNHANKYGVDDLVFNLITSCDKNDLLALEQFYLDALNPWFNICPIAGNTSGRPVSDITRKKISELHKGRSPWSKGKKLTEAHKQHIREAMSGEKNHQYGKPSPRKGKRGYPSPFKGKKGRYSEETLEKMRRSNKRAWEARKEKEVCDARN